MKTPIRTARAALLMLTALAACASTASAAGGQYDANYGTVPLPIIPGKSWYPATQCETLNNRSIAVSAQVPGDARAHAERRETTAVLIAKPNGSSRRGWKYVKSDVGEVLIASDFAPDGTFAYVHGQRTDRKARSFVVRKAGLDGKNVPGWHAVTLKLPRPATGPSFVSVSILNLNDGGVLLSVNRFDGLRLFRFTKSGKPADFGAKGVVAAAATEAKSAAPYAYRPATPLLETYDGSLLVAASGRPGEPRVSDAIGLLKLDKRGAVVDSFADHGYWNPPGGSARTVGVGGGESVGMPLTVVAETLEANSKWRVTATQFSEAGSQTATSASFESGMNIGGFTLVGAFDFKRTAGGFIYASGLSDLESEGFGSNFGQIVGLDPLLSKPPSESRFASAKGRLLTFDYAATPDGKYVYGCGGYRPKRVKSGTPGTTHAPALKRFKL